MGIWSRHVMPEPQRSFDNHYTEGSLLGTGSFGQVHECTDISTLETYACKTIAKKSIRTKEGWEDLTAEIKAMKLLQGGDGGVVQLKEVFDDQSEVRIVMELCRGGDLFELICSNGRLPEPAARLVFIQLAQALQCCHSRGVVHRDVKPENILFDVPALALYNMTLDDSPPPAVNAKLADFGLSTVLKPKEKTKGMVGSRRYTAPELLAGRPYGRRVDVWSLGVVLFAMLSGRLPFFGQNEKDIDGLTRAILRGNPTFSSHWVGISEGAKDLVRRMLQVDPAQRLTSFDLTAHPWVQGRSGATLALGGGRAGTSMPMEIVCR